MDRKTAAQKLMDMADAIDRQAAEESFFVCRACNHTASLASINDKRVKVASEQGVQDVEAVTVNDTITCPACGDGMSYVPTEFSERYYVEATDEPPVEKKEEETVVEEPVKPSEDPVPEEAPVPVDDDDETPDEGDDDDETLNLDYEGDENPAESEPKGEVGDTSGEGDPTFVEEVSEPDPEPKKKPKKKDKPDDGKPRVPKNRVPKFEFPKKARDEAFMKIVSKYL